VPVTLGTVIAYHNQLIEMGENVTENLRITHLASVPDVVPTLVRLFIEEWEPYYGHEGPGNAEHDLRECLNRCELPLALVALDADRNVVGTVALRSECFGEQEGEGPWLRALVVPKTHRGHGIGTLLTASIENEARRRGFPAIYTTTDGAEGIVRRRGWQPLRSAMSLRGVCTVYKQDLRKGD